MARLLATAAAVSGFLAAFAFFLFGHGHFLRDLVGRFLAVRADRLKSASVGRFDFLPFLGFFFAPSLARFTFL